MLRHHRGDLERQHAPAHLYECRLGLPEALRGALDSDYPHPRSNSTVRGTASRTHDADSHQPRLRGIRQGARQVLTRCGKGSSWANRFLPFSLIAGVFFRKVSPAVVLR